MQNQQILGIKQGRIEQQGRMCGVYTLGFVWILSDSSQSTCIVVD